MARRYKLLAGKHTQKERVLDDKGHPKKDERGNDLRVPATYKRGEVFYSDSDLLKLNAPGAIKFELLDQPPQNTLSDAQVRGRSVAPSDQDPRPNAAPGGQVSSGIQETVGSASPSQVGPREFEERASAAVAREKVQGTAEKGNLDSLSDEQLKQLAAEEGVDVRSATDRAGVLKAFRDARGTQAGQRSTQAQRQPAQVTGQEAKKK